MPNDGDRANLKLNALSLADAARLLTRVGGQPITVAMLEEDIANGAPVNADGTMHLVHYGAWLVLEMGRVD